jgi:hypothetical protein
MNRLAAKLRRHRDDDAVILQAQGIYLAQMKEWPKVPSTRKAFNDLGIAVRQLQAALRPFEAGLPQAVLHHALNEYRMTRHGGSPVPVDSPELAKGDAVTLLLGHLNIVATERGGTGLEKTVEAYRWVAIAADAWAAAGKPPPNSSERGRFWQALKRFNGKDSGRNPKMPMVTNAIVEGALKDWKELKDFRESLRSIDEPPAG